MVPLKEVMADAIATGFKLAVGKCIVRKAGEGAAQGSVAFQDVLHTTNQL